MQPRVSLKPHGFIYLLVYFIYLLVYPHSSSQTLTCQKVKQRFSSSPWAAYFPFSVLHLCSLQLLLMKSFFKPQRNKPMWPTGYLLLPQKALSSFPIWHKERKRDWLKNGSCLFDTLMLRTELEQQSKSISDKMSQERHLYVHKCQWDRVRKCAAVRKQPVLEQTPRRLLSIEFGCAAVERTLCCWPL